LIEARLFAQVVRSQRMRSTAAKDDKKLASFLKLGLLLAFTTFFGFTLYRYFKGELQGNATWLWPLLFVPLMLYLLGILFGDVPARYFRIDPLKPFPTPFANQYDRCVLALIALFSGLFLNAGFLVLALIFGAQGILTILYAVYMVLMTIELPTTLRIFRFIQHVNTIQYASDLNPATFKRAVDYYDADEPRLDGEDLQIRLREIYSGVIDEAKKLIQEDSPLDESQQLALNLSVRSGEAIKRARLAKQDQDDNRYQANLLLLEALRQFASLEVPEDLIELRKTPL